MFAKYMTTTLLGSALMATAAFAQAPTTPSTSTSPPAATSTAPASTTTTPAAADKTTVAPADSTFHGDWRTSKLVGLKVYNDKNESIGSISEMLADKDGKIAAVVIGVGGILGVGEHDVAVPFDKIKWVTEPVAYTGAGGAGGSAMTKSAPGSTTTTGSASSAPAAATKTNPWYPDHAVFNATKDELKSMPEFKYSE